MLKVMGAHRPARAVVPVGNLRPGCILEVQAIAAQEVPEDTGI